ncbi:Leucine Rich repeat-containing domain protein, partial [Trichostrongylus colubriformis]
LNSTNFRSLRHAERVRTLTIRCPHFSKKKSTPPPGLFQDFRNLDRLEIDRCVLTSLPTALLSVCLHPGSIFHKLFREHLPGLTKLYSLIIKNAKLPSIPDELLRYTPNLMTLDLSGNALRIEPYTLRSLQLPERLTDLSLRNNYITTIHYAPESARSLHRIDLAGNQLDFIVGSGSVNMLPPSLKQVDLSRNRITFIQEGALGHMKELALLDLKSNLLTELKESSVSGPQNQLRMFLEGNPFQCHCGLRWLFHVKTKVQTGCTSRTRSAHSYLHTVVGRQPSVKFDRSR